MEKRYMAIDQYGHAYHDLRHPRKDLCERLGCQNAAKMYRDRKDRTLYHAGYVIAGLWLTLFEVTPFEKEVHNGQASTF